MPLTHPLAFRLQNSYPSTLEDFLPICTKRHRQILTESMWDSRVDSNPDVKEGKRKISWGYVHNGISYSNEENKHTTIRHNVDDSYKRSWVKKASSSETI